MFPIRERAYDYEPLAVPRNFQVVLPLDLEHRRKRRDRGVQERPHTRSKKTDVDGEYLSTFVSKILKSKQLPG